MDWNAAIEKNREALKRILAVLVAMAALPVLRACGEPGGAAVLPRHLHRAVLRLLRPAEAAARRLVIVAARGLVGRTPPALRGETKPPPRQRPRARRKVALPLIDPLRPWGDRRRPAPSGVPRISFPGFSAPFPVPVRRPPSPDDPIDATRLSLRLAALASALDDLPRQARRFARWRARRRRGPFHRTQPLRPGRPPGWRRKPVHEAHEILNVTHGLAFWALEAPDTS